MNRGEFHMEDRWATVRRQHDQALVFARSVLSVTHFRVGLCLFVGDAGAPAVELSR